MKLNPTQFVTQVDAAFIDALAPFGFASAGENHHDDWHASRTYRSGDRYIEINANCYFRDGEPECRVILGEGPDDWPERDSNESVDLNSVAKSISDKAAELKEAIDPETLTDLQEKFSALSLGLQSSDIVEIREKTSEIDHYLDSRIWGWYADIYEANLNGGKTAAQDEIKSIQSLHGTRQYERDALDAISNGLESDLGLQDGAILESVAVQSLRSKFGDTVTEVVVTIVLGALLACRHGC